MSCRSSDGLPILDMGVWVIKLIPISYLSITLNLEFVRTLWHFTLKKACSHRWRLLQEVSYPLDDFLLAQLFLLKYLFQVFRLNNPEVSPSLCCCVLAAVQSVYTKDLRWGPGHRVPPLLQQVPLQLHAQRSIAATPTPSKQLDVPLTGWNVVSVHTELQQRSDLILLPIRWDTAVFSGVLRRQ